MDNKPTYPNWELNSAKGIRCFDKIKRKIVYAYWIDESGGAHNKKNTMCIGNMFADLAVQPLIKLKVKK